MPVSPVVNLKKQLNSFSELLSETTVSLTTAGLLIAVIALLLMLWQNPWGISAGYRNWGDWMLFWVGATEVKPSVPWLNGISVSNIGLLAGAFASALLSGKFVLQNAPLRDYLKAAIGGVLMGAGAVLAGGCNVGGFYSAVGLFSIGGYAMMAGLILGAFFGLKVLIWDINRNDSSDTTGKFAQFQIQFPEKIQQFLGIAVLLLIILLFYYYSGKEKTIEGGLLFFGLMIGLIMHRSRFCFARAFRCPFMTGDSGMVKVIALSLLVYGAGASVIKWAYIQPPGMGTHHPFWIGSLMGGILFGTGMVIAGGCASSTLWRLGEGNMKLFATLVAFSLTNSLLYPLKNSTEIVALLGKGGFLPEIITWQIALPVFILILVIWVSVADWNEKTDKLVIF